MRTMEMRKVEVIRCDFCKEETTSVIKCAVCKREGCHKDGGAAHFAYSLELYRYGDGKRLAGFGSHVCKECAEKKPDLTIKAFFDGMMDRKTPIFKN